ncbi:MAG: hypothetical protein Q7S60_00805 [bacterium]|nr:hypothetical protein [bacterium]
MARNLIKLPLGRIVSKGKIKSWVELHYFQLAVFNIVLMVLLLLRSAGYFEPYFGITINSIFLIALILSVFLLGTQSRGAFAVALAFWLFAAVLKLVRIDTWAERTAIYSFQALVIGVVLLIWESLFDRRKESDV